MRFGLGGGVDHLVEDATQATLAGLARYLKMNGQGRRVFVLPLTLTMVEVVIPLTTVLLSTTPHVSVLTKQIVVNPVINGQTKATPITIDGSHSGLPALNEVAGDQPPTNTTHYE